MRLASSVLWSLLGNGLPLLAALVAVPALVEALGTSRFGILSLAWVVVGYFTLFDLGLGRALTHEVSQRIGAGRDDEIPSIAWSALQLMLLLGLLGGALLASATPWLVATQLKLPGELSGEAKLTLWLLAASIPVVIVTTGLRGVLEAYQRFDVVNAVRGPLGALNYLAPLAILPFTQQLPPLVAMLVAVRIALCLTYAYLCWRIYPTLRRPRALDRANVGGMLAYGGWITLSSVTAPLLLYSGRLWLAVSVSTAAVAYFSTPYDIVMNLLLIPSVFASVLFPMIAQQFQVDRGGVSRLYSRSLLQLGAVMLPLCLVTFVFAQPMIAAWLDPEFAQQSYRVAKWLAIGVFVNSFGHIAQALVQACGRPDLTAKLHTAELALYLPYMVWLIDRHGIEGAAVAWVVRVTISTLVLSVIARRCLSGAIRTSQVNVKAHA